MLLMQYTCPIVVLFISDIQSFKLFILCEEEKSSESNPAGDTFPSPPLGMKLGKGCHSTMLAIVYAAKGNSFALNIRSIHGFYEMLKPMHLLLEHILLP